MKLSVLELMILENTLSGSLRISDEGRIFGYTEASRETLHRKIMSLLNDMKLTVEIGQEPDGNQAS